MGVGDREPSGDPWGSQASVSDGGEAIETGAVADLGVDFAFRLDPSGTVTAVSGDVERLLGKSAETVVGDRFERYLTSGTLETAYDALDAVLSGETVRGMALRIDGDGEGHPWIEVNAEPIRGAKEEVVAVRGAAREATERRRTIERHSAAMKGAMDGMALLDDDGHYLFVNEAHAELYGYDREVLVGSHWSRLYDAAEQERLEQEALPEMADSGDWRGTAVGRRADGSSFQQELSLSALDVGFVCVVRDVTDRTQREQIIDVLDRVLRHNLRNEMNVVMGEAERVARNGQGETAAAAERIRERARSLLTVSDTARTVREVVSGEHDSGRRDLRSAVQQACSQVAAEGHGIAASLPDGPLYVASPGVHHAVRELVENAVEHGSTGSGRATGGGDPDGAAPAVSVDLSRIEGGGDAPMAVLRVADSGPGIPRMERVTLEEGSETPLRHGQGLGLWLVNWVATEAGGDLSVRERERGGTVVEMWLPLMDADGNEGRSDDG